MRSRENSSISRPSTTCQSPPADVTGNEHTRPSGTPYSPRLYTPALVQSPSRVVVERFEDELLAPVPGRKGNYVTLLGRAQIAIP